MARLQWCRNHIDDVAKACNLSDSAKFEVKQAGKFCDEHSDFAELPTRPILTLIRIKDEQVRARAISSCKNRLNQTNATGGKWHTSLTEKEVKKIIEDVEIEVRNEKIEKIVADEEAEEERTGIHKITQKEVDELMGRNNEPEPEKDPVPTINKQGNLVHSEEEVEKIKAETPSHIIINTIMQFEIDLYFEVMEKIGCQDDYKKHKKRMDMMIENKTLLIVG
jgi:hypothetical protein